MPTDLDSFEFDLFKLYFYGSAVALVLYILWFVIFKQLCGKLCAKACCKRSNDIEVLGGLGQAAKVSDDLYQHLSFRTLRNEYFENEERIAEMTRINNTGKFHKPYLT